MTNLKVHLPDLAPSNGEKLHLTNANVSSLEWFLNEMVRITVAKYDSSQPNVFFAQI